MDKPKVKPRFWIIITLLLLVVCAVIQLLAVISPNWFEVHCKNGTISLGLWQYCGDPVELLMINKSNGDTNPAILHLYGYKQEPEICTSVGNYLFIGHKGNPGMAMLVNLDNIRRTICVYKMLKYQ